jgi:hypothetical protein
VLVRGQKTGDAPIIGVTETSKFMITVSKYLGMNAMALLHDHLSYTLKFDPGHECRNHRARNGGDVLRNRRSSGRPDSQGCSGRQKTSEVSHCNSSEDRNREAEVANATRWERQDG